MLLAENAYDLQVMLNMQEYYANMERYFISESKSKIMIFNSKRNHININELYLNDKKLDEVSEYTHIGLYRSHKDQQLVNERIKVARRTSYALMGAGLHGYNGVNPNIGIQVWNTYVRPRLLFGLDSVVLSKRDVNELNLFHKGQLKSLLNLPERTADAAVYILSGQLPIEAFIHYMVLVNLGNILSNNRIEKEIAVRQLLVKKNDSHSWFIYAAKLLELYDLDSIFYLIENMPSKCSWKASVKKKIEFSWLNKINKMSEGKSSLQYLSSSSMVIGKPHNVWNKCGNDPVAIKKANVKSRLLAGVYILQSMRSKFNQHKVSPVCLLCGKGIEDTEHFVMSCVKLEKIRNSFLKLITKELLIIDSNFQLNNNKILLQVMMDITHPKLPIMYQKQHVYHSIEAISRGLLYALHRERCQILGLTIL